MARPRNHVQHITTAVESLVRSISSLIGSLEASLSSRAGSVAAAVKGRGGRPAQRGPGRNNPKLKAAIKASWARMTPAERKARVAKMLAGRGLKPKKG